LAISAFQLEQWVHSHLIRLYAILQFVSDKTQVFFVIQLFCSYLLLFKKRCFSTMPVLFLVDFPIIFFLVSGCSML
jgi:hypothetical protein